MSSRWSVLFVFLKAKGCPLKVLTRELEGCFLKKNSCLEFLLLAFSEWFCFRSCSGELFVSPLVHTLSLFVLSFGFSCPFLSFFVSLSCHCCCGLLLASSMAESYRCFRNCRRNSVRRLVLVIDLYPLKGADEVSGEVVVVKSISYILLLMVPEQVWDWHFCSYQCVFFVFCLFLSSLVWFFVWLPEEELTLLFLLHRENGDFSILMKDISFLLVSELFFHLLLLHQLRTKTTALWNLAKNWLQLFASDHLQNLSRNKRQNFSICCLSICCCLRVRIFLLFLAP